MSEITWMQLTPEEQAIIKSLAASKTLSHAWLSERYVDFANRLIGLGLIYFPSGVNTKVYMLTDAGRALIASQQPDGGADVPAAGEDEPTYNASTNWINKPKAQAREEMEAGWQAVEIERLQAEVEQQQEVVPKLLYALGVDPSDWVASDSGIKAAIDSNLKVASGEITDREEWGDVPEDTITEAIFKLRDRVDGLQAANVELTTRNRALLNAVAFAVDALDGLGPLDALTRLYALKRKVDALK